MSILYRVNFKKAYGTTSTELVQCVIVSSIRAKVPSLDRTDRLLVHIIHTLTEPMNNLSCLLFTYQ